MGCLRKENSNGSANSRRGSLGGPVTNIKKDQLQVPSPLRRNSKMYSTDSLDGRRNSWDPGRRGSCGSSGHEDEVVRKVDKDYLA